MPALRRKRRRFPLLPQRRHRPQRGKHRFCLRFCPCRCPVFPPALSIRQTFQVFNLNPPALRPTARPHIRRRHACPRLYGMHYHRRPFFRKKPRIGCPANLLENDFPPGYLFCQPFISQNLWIILTHNHRRRCGNDFIADARAHASRRFFAKSSTVDVSVSRISNSASARPEMMLKHRRR